MDHLMAIRDYLDTANNALESAVCEAEENESVISARQFDSLETAQAEVFAVLQRIEARLRGLTQSEVHP